MAGMGRKRKEVDQSTYSGRVAARLRLLREKAGKTVPEMAKAVGVSSASIYAWERNSRDVALDSVPRICEVLGIKPRKFFDV